METNKLANVSIKLNIFVCFEKNCGGETIATKNIISTLNEIKEVKLRSYASSTVNDWKILPLFSWVIESTASWAKIILKRKSINWVYTTTFTAGFAASLFKPFLKYKICFHYHGSRIPENPRNLLLLRRLTQQIKISCLVCLHYFFLLFTDLIIVPSQFTKDELTKRFSIVKYRKIVVIPGGVDKKFLQKSTRAAISKVLKNLSISPKEKIVTYLGRFDKEKNLHLLITAFHFILKVNPNCILLIVHFKPRNPVEKSYKQYLHALSNKLYLRKKVIWIQNPKDIKIYYYISDLVVLPSNKENFPLVMPEALACKRLFLGTYVGGIKEVLPKIDSRLIIKDKNPKRLANQILFILNLSEYEKKEIIDKGYNLARQLSWNKISKKIYQYLIS